VERGFAVSSAREKWKQEARTRYRQITGFDEPNPVAIWHHRLSLFGPPCNVCGKPLRTPRAKLCAECGNSRSDTGRRRVYENARITFKALLKNQKPPLPEAEIDRHQLALESAIHQVELVASSNANQTPERSHTEYSIDGFLDTSTGREVFTTGGEVSKPAVTAPAPGVKRVPIWPVLIAPLVAVGYYVALKSAFSISIVSALGENATVDIVENIGIWGSHWLYRLVAEILSVGFGTFIAAGLARGRERAAATIGSFTIALGFILFWLAFLIFRSGYTSLMALDIENYSPEPDFCSRSFISRRDANSCTRPLALRLLHAFARGSSTGSAFDGSVDLSADKGIHNLDRLVSNHRARVQSIYSAASDARRMVNSEYRCRGSVRGALFFPSLTS
jgi:hypothetical protein